MKLRKDGTNKGLKPTEQRKREEEIGDLIGRNYTDEEIENSLGLQPHVVQIYKQRLAVSAKIRIQSMTKQDWFNWFMYQSVNTIKELHEAKQHMQHQKRTCLAQVQATRLQNKVLSDIFRLAFQLGLVTRRARQISWNGLTLSKDTRFVA